MLFHRPKWPLFVLSPILLLLFSCNPGSDDHDHPELISGQQLFEHHCADCHDKTGMGTFLKGVPANITTRKTQNEIVIYLQEGPHTFNKKAPIFKAMTDNEARKIARHLLRLKRTYYNDPKHADKFILERQNKTR